MVKVEISRRSAMLTSHWHIAYLLRALQLLVKLIKQGLDGGPIVDVHLVLQHRERRSLSSDTLFVE